MGLTPGTGAPARPPYARPGYLALVLVGGAVGTGARAAMESAAPAPAGGWPTTTFVINVSGSFVLGVLLTWLGRSGPDRGWRRAIRLGVGTGVLGGYTTYSTFAVEVDRLLSGGHVATGAAYAAGSLAAGVGAALVGVLGTRAVLRGGPR